MNIPERIAQAVASSPWDAVVVLGQENVHYWSGLLRDPARVYLDRAFMVVWRRGGEPIYIGGSEVIESLRRRSFISRFVGYEQAGVPPPEVIVDTLAAVLRDEGLETGVLGLEMMRTPVPFYERLQSLLPRAKLEAADEMLWRLRITKTAEEVTLMRRAGRATEDSIHRVFADARAGDAELDLAVQLHRNLLRAGCVSVPVLMIGTGKRAREYGPAGPSRLQPGEMVRVDVNTLFAAKSSWGMLFRYCDMGRMAVVGEASEIQQRAFRAQVELKRRILEFIRPGVAGSQVYNHCCDQADRMNIRLYKHYYVGVGHGVGANPDEPPKLNAKDHTILQEGMVLAVEPDTIGPAGELLHSEDMIYITPNGAEVLTDTLGCESLPVIPA